MSAFDPLQILRAGFVAGVPAGGALLQQQPTPPKAGQNWVCLARGQCSARDL